MSPWIIAQPTDFQVAKLITMASTEPKVTPFSTVRFTTFLEPSGRSSISSITSFGILLPLFVKYIFIITHFLKILDFFYFFCGIFVKNAIFFSILYIEIFYDKLQGRRRRLLWEKRVPGEGFSEGWQIVSPTGRTISWILWEVFLHRKVVFAGCQRYFPIKIGILGFCGKIYCQNRPFV